MPERIVRRLQLVTDALVAPPAPIESALAAQILARASDAPGAVALVSSAGPTTFGELAATADRFAEQLRPLGGGAAEPVLVTARKSPATVALILACLARRRPVLLLSTQLPEQQTRLLALTAGCRWLLAADGDDLQCAALEGPQLSRAPDLSGVGLLLTTSGSTGLPKIVPLRHPQLERFVSWATRFADLGPDTVSLNIAPLNFDICLLDVWATLAAGGSCVLVDPDRAVFGQHLLDLSREHGVTLVQTVPMFLSLMVAAYHGHDPRHPECDRGRGPLSRVREVISTGDLLSQATLRALPEVFAAATLHNLYGCTETNDTFVATIRDPRTVSWPLTLGEPIPGVEQLVVDEHGKALTGPGRGELLVRSPFQTAGYLDAERNLAKFVELTGPSGRQQWFRTGDVVSRDSDGALRLAGRIDFQVKVRGVAVNLNAVEQALLSHPEVRSSAVVAVPDDLGGHRLYGSVQRQAGSTLSVLALRQYCVKRLTRAAVPAVLHVGDDPLPRTPTGKVDRVALSTAALAEQHNHPRPRPAPSPALASAPALTP